MRRMSLAVWCLLGIQGSLVWGQDTPADLLPATTAVYLEVSRPSELVQEIKDHALWDELAATPTGERAFANPQLVQGQLVLSFLELRLGKTWQEALEVLTDKGVAVGVDAATEGVALVARGTSEEEVNDLRDTLMSMAREEAKKKGEPDPYTTTDYRGITVYKTKDGGFVTHGNWILTANNPDLGKKMLDQLLDGGDQTLAKHKQFQDVATRQRGSDLWGYLDVTAIREQPKVQKALFGHAENPLAELLVGGLQEVLRKTPYVTLAADVEADQFQLTIDAPVDPTQISEARSYWFGPEGTGVAPALVAVPGQILALSTYRNVSEMWLRAGDLFDERMNDKLAEADANLTTLFSGKDFGSEVLGSLQPELLLVVTRQTFAADGLQPAIKLPAFGVLAQLKDPDNSRRELRRIFQSLIGFLNVAGAMNGQPQLELNFQNEGGVDLVSADYLPEAGEEKSQTAPINYNFSPTVAFQGENFVLCSTSQLAKTLLSAAPAGPAVAPRAAIPNTLAQLQTDSLSDALEDNKGQLIAQNMLEKGHSRDEAAEEIGAIFDLLDLLQRVDLNLATNPATKTFGIRLEIH